MTERTSAPAGASSSVTERACDECLRRAWLLARVAGYIEVARHGRRALPEILALPDETLIPALETGETARIWRERERFDAAGARAAVAAARLTALCRHDEAYPARLRHATDAPAALFVGGALEHLAAFHGEERSVAIVGARNASPEALDVARAFGRDLARAGVPVVSGMALGVDAAAQQGALDAGGLSIAVLGSGADRAYPASKARLHAALLERGLVVSELPPGTTPRKWTFPARNRIIAGLADLTVVVEATERSGSLITAELATKLGRDVAAVPGPVLSPRAAGTNALLRDGAILVRHVHDILDALYGAGAAPAAPRRAHGDGLEPELATLLQAVAEGRDTVAALAEGSRARADAATAGLAELEMRGLVTRRGGGHYGIVP